MFLFNNRDSNFLEHCDFMKQVFKASKMYLTWYASPLLFDSLKKVFIFYFYSTLKQRL